MTDKGSLDYSLASARGFTEAESLAVLRGPEPKVKATKKELVEALIEVRDRCARVAEARAVARRVLGE